MQCLHLTCESMLNLCFDRSGQYGHWKRGSCPHSWFSCRHKLLRCKYFFPQVTHLNSFFPAFSTWPCTFHIWVPDSFQNNCYTKEEKIMLIENIHIIINTFVLTDIPVFLCIFIIPTFSNRFRRASDTLTQSGEYVSFILLDWDGYP